VQTLGPRRTDLNQFQGHVGAGELGTSADEGGTRTPSGGRGSDAQAVAPLPFGGQARALSLLRFGRDRSLNSGQGPSDDKGGGVESHLFLMAQLPLDGIRWR
jgi:hypothetical protein